MSATLRKIRAACMKRSGESCEACGRTDRALHLDHYFGRAKVPESVANCWMLCSPCCDEAKTTSRPNAAHWHHEFARHAEIYAMATPENSRESRAYWEAARLARTKLNTLVAKGLAHV